MSVQTITTTYSFSYSMPAIDSEEKEIMARLLSYGVTPTGNKSTDKATLRKIEYRKAQEDNTVSDKYLTVSRSEQQKIQEAKKNKQKEHNPETQLNKKNIAESKTGANYLGQQIYLAIKMKER